MSYIKQALVLTTLCYTVYSGGWCTRPCRPCLSLPDCNTTTIDDCGCCDICVRGLDEECGGAFGIYGKCEKGLECTLIANIVIADIKGAPEFTGVCKNATGKPDCGSIECPPFTFECPWDSKYVDGDTPPNRCCKVPGKCECDHTKCNNVNCPVGYIKQLQSPAMNTPSQCCDTYECLPEKVPVGVCSDPQSGLKYEDGEYWKKDECTGCTCFAGAAKCYNIDCPRLTCAFPVKPVNACCPRCPKNSECDDFKCDLDCEQGYVNDDRDCPLCACNQRKECNLTDCKKDCPNGFKIGSDGCEVCSCHECHPMKNCNINCGYGMEKDVRGCAICKCQTDSDGNEHPAESYQCYDNSGIMHPEGSSWTPNPCSDCTCYRGSSVCSIVDCAQHTCENPIQKQGQCCPVCEEGCTDNRGLYRGEGLQWESGCLDCNCRNSTIQCHPLQCPILQCTDSIKVPGQCCEVCPSAGDIVPESEQEFVVVVAASESLGALQERQSSFLKHLSSGNEYVFRIKMLFASDIQRLRDKPGKITEMGSIALLNALEKATSSLIRAEKVVPHLQILYSVEPDVVKVMTYPEYLKLTENQALTHRSRLSSVAIAGTIIAAVCLTLIVLGYFGRRHLLMAHRRKFKHTASMGQSADQLIHAVDNSRLTIHLSRPRQISVDSMLSTSPSPGLESSPFPGAHDNLGNSPFPGAHDNLGNYNKVNTS